MVEQTYHQYHVDGNDVKNLRKEQECEREGGREEIRTLSVCVCVREQSFIVVFRKHEHELWKLDFRDLRVYKLTIKQ